MSEKRNQQLRATAKRLDKLFWKTFNAQPRTDAHYTLFNRIDRVYDKVLHRLTGFDLRENG